jgi:hypothetical protein
MFPPGSLPSMRSQTGSADERRLGKLFRSLDAQQREALLSFAEFLVQRASGRQRDSGGLPTSSSYPGPADAPGSASGELVGPDVVSQVPLVEPRPAQESVVAGIRRLRRTYPMLDTGEMLNEASSLMAAHVLHGRPASAVIDELEALFAERFDAHRSRGD